MPKVKIVRPGGRVNRKPLGEVGEVVDVDERLASALIQFKYAAPVEDEPVEVPETETEADTADARETATDKGAEDRETRDAKPVEDEPVKRGPGRPRKTDDK